jgi:hypothetical protein
MRSMVEGASRKLTAEGAGGGGLMNIAKEH